MGHFKDPADLSFGPTRRGALAVIAGAAVLPFEVSAQSDRPIRMIVPSSAGAGIDATIRVAQSALSRALGAPIVIDNQAGAGGLIGFQTLARGKPDGSILGICSNGLVILPAVMKALPFDVSKDFTPIAIIGSIPLVLVVNPTKVPATNAKEFAALLKAKSDTLNFASSGAGALLHLATEMLLDELGVKVRHIPYKGVGPMVTDIIGGQVDFGIVALPAVQAYLKSGSLRAVGVCTPQRVPIAPEIPTFVEQGFPKYVVEAWVAILGPKGMPPELIKKTHSAVVSAFGDPAVKDALVKQGTMINIGTPEEAQTTLRRDMLNYAAVAKKIGLEPQ